MKVERFAENPLITPADVKPSRPDFEVICAFNAGVAKYNGETILLLRVAERPLTEPGLVRVPVLKCDTSEPHIEILEFSAADPLLDLTDPRVIYTPKGILLTSISHLRIARSADGRNFTVDPQPAIMPDRPSEMYGLEDPRITEIDGLYYIAYKSVASTGISTSLAITSDFIHFRKQGIIFHPENLDVSIFPEKVNGRYVALHRPVPRFIGAPNMWVAYSPDLIHWGDHHFLMDVQPGNWESSRIGAGTVPIRTEYGWLEIYHGATSENHYGLGAILMDLEAPHVLIARGKDPIMLPEAPYETTGFMPNVIFTCGAIAGDDVLDIYYGVGDESMAGARLSISEIIDGVLS
jgi:predicted GH43/DUF377 family glycosyl hydrolase